MKIYLSGLYCGTNPQPGVGMTRSLRAAYPDATLIGVEYSTRCSGIHWTDLDDVWLQRPWEELDLDAYRDAVARVLESGGLWISGFDLEIMWLATVFPNGHENLLTPPPTALRRISKPIVEATRHLPISIPPFISTENSDWDLHAFCRQHDWKLWLKGPYYEAIRAHSWEVVETYRTLLARAWSTEKLFLQTHVTGYEESICFGAYQGELTGAVYMRKKELTEEGKTWAGEISDVPEEFIAPLQEMVKELNWSGGAELEMVRDTAGKLWLLECNPRFPAWIHGSTIAGTNLPALMVEKATGLKRQPGTNSCEQFTRVVLEVPVREQFPLSPLPEPYPGAVGFSLKHPSGTLALAKRLHETNGLGMKANGNGNGNGNANGNGNGNGKTGQVILPTTVPDSYIADIDRSHVSTVETPNWIYLESTAKHLFARAQSLALEMTNTELVVTNAYSIKTNPDERLLRLARESDFLAEAISLLEVQKALEVGFKSEQIILNGPGKFWPSGLLPSGQIHAVFCDSIADLNRVSATVRRGELQSKIVGVRLRPSNVASRFGIPVDSPETLERLIQAIETLPETCLFGVHFHMASSNVGVKQWWHLFDSMLRWAQSIEKLGSRKIEYLDLGGGWFPDDWHLQSNDRFQTALARAAEALPSLKQIISEPGKALAQPCMAVAMRLLEFDDSLPQPKEAVVDGSIAELPMHFFQPHRILWQNRSTGEWQPLGRGVTQLFGRLCMEHDIVARGVELPPEAAVGDLLIFCDAGAYDRSMSYVFGRG
jgi:diaminopimelate decarboxylase